MYQFLPNNLYLENHFDNLPNEILCLILRNLDGNALMQAYNVSNHWKAVIKTDPILRKTLKAQIRKIKRENEEAMYTGSIQVEIQRQSQQVTMFNKNMAKSVKTIVKMTATLPKMMPKSSVIKTTFNNGNKPLRLRL